MENETESPKIIALIPAFNEELTIASMVVLTAPLVWKVIVIDDGSTDRTAAVAEKVGASVISLSENTGKAAALRAGFKESKKYGPDCVVMIDGDGQMDPAQIPALCKPIIDGDADLVIGSRYLGKEKIPNYRKMGLSVLNSTTNLGSNTKVTDSQSGFRALSRSALDHTDFKSESYSIETDMIVYFASKGLRITEISTRVRYDVPNGHKQSPLKQGMSVLSRAIGYVGYRRPLLLFGVPGMASFIAGIILAFATLEENKIIFQWTIVTQGIAGLSLFALGIFLLCFALVLNSLGILMDKMR